MMKDDVKTWLNEQFEGDAEMIRLVWAEYLVSAKAKLAEARAALAAEDYPLLDRVAHTLKGNALMVGDAAIVTVTIALRDAAKASDGTASDRALARLVELDAENRA